MKIEQRITYTFVNIFILFFATSALLISTITSFILSQQSYQQILTSSLSKTELIRTYLNHQKELVSTLQTSIIFHDLLNTPSPSEYISLKAKVNDQLSRTISVDKNFDELFLIDKKGIIIASTKTEHIGVDISADPFFFEGEKGLFVKDIYFPSDTNNIEWGISSPIYQKKTGIFLGVLVARIQVAPLFSLAKSPINIGKTAESFIVNEKGYLLTPSLYTGEKDVLSKKIDTQNVDLCFKNQAVDEKIKISRDYRNILTISTHSSIPEIKGCLLTKVDLIEVYTPVFIIMATFFAAILIGSFIFYLVSTSLSRKITAPIELLYKGMQEIQRGNYQFKIDTDSQDEVGALSRQFDLLISTVNETQATIDQKVKDQTKEIVQKTQNLQDQKKAILNILEDVERAKDKADALALDLRKFALAVENANDHIIITDADGIILFANKAVELVTGFSQKEVIGKKAGSKELWGGLMTLGFYKSLWKTIKIDKKPLLSNVKNKRKNGEIYIAKASISPVLNEKNEVEYFVGIERDITKEVEVDKMKTEFISLASHQLRTPLSAMRWFAEMLLNGDMGALSAEQAEAVHNIYSSNERMIALVNSLLNISRIESGRIIIDPKPTDVNLLINDVINGLKKKLDEKNQKAIITIHPNLPSILLDEKLIHEVYMNLLTNAIKYSPKNSEIIITISKKNDELMSQISDAGYGIPDRQKDKIFQKFFRADNIAKRETDGTGLGLYLVKSIIESSNGKIWFESVEDKGTSFWFTLPISGMKAKKGDVSLS